MPKRGYEQIDGEDLRSYKPGNSVNESLATPHGHVYPSIKLYGNARAIFGDAPGADILGQRINEQERKRLILRSLHFQDMRARRDQVDSRAGSPTSIQWVWATDFASWLERGQSFFWITGTPGSGKSTLMKHISESKRTHALLSNNGESWLVVHFYFDFRAGNNVANSLEGLLRSLLFQLVQNVPELDIFDDGSISNVDANLSVSQYMDHLCDALRSTKRRVCAFIDGLDEFKGSNLELFDLINRLEDRGNLKICLASRSVQNIQQHLGKHPHLTMQYHNNESIRVFAETALAESVILATTPILVNVTKQLVQKANGNFLWARLVVDELLMAIKDRKSIDAVLEILNSLPEEVQAMYETILERIPPFLKREAAVLIHLILQSEGRVALRKLYAAYTSVLNQTDLEAESVPIDIDGALEKRLLAILGGLVEVSPRTRLSIVYTGGQVSCGRHQHDQVRLTHESLSSFLHNSGWLRKNLPEYFLAAYNRDAWLKVQIEEILACSVLDEDSLTQVAAAFDRLLLVLRRSEREGLSTYDRRRVALLNFLHSWPSWTPFLLYAVEDIFVTFTTCPHVTEELRKSLREAMQSRAMYLHCALCIFHNFVGSESSSSYAYESCGDMVKRPELFAVSKTNKPHDLSLSLAVCHGIPDAIHLEKTIEVLDLPERQSIFNIFFMKGITSTLHQGFQPYLNQLAESGCKLSERELCRFLLTNDPSRPTVYFDLLEKHLYPTSLRGHAARCNAYTPDDPRRLSFWHHFASWWCPSGPEGLAQAVRLVKLLLSRGLLLTAPLFEKPDNIMHSILEKKRTELYSRNRMTKLIACIQAGGNLKARGEHGSVYDYAEAYCKTMKDDPDHKNRWTDYDGKETRTAEAKMIVELLGHHKNHGSLPEGLEHYLNFSCP